MDAIFKIESARLIKAERTFAEVAWRQPAHSHPFWEFVYFMRGYGEIVLPHASYKAQQYYMSIYPPGMPHKETTDPSNPEEIIGIKIDVPGNPPPNVPLLVPDHYGKFRSLCEWILEESLAYGNTFLLEGYVRAFLRQVERAWESQLPKQYDIVSFAIHYLHANYGQEITVRSLAEATHVSETCLAHQFTVRSGISPMKYLRDIRIEAAKRLLATTPLQISDIAKQTGLPDPAYFARVFKEVTGQSPSEFRNKANGLEKSFSSSD